MNLIWFPLVGFLLRARSSPVQPRRQSVPRIAVEDSAQIDPARLRQMSTDVSLPVAVRVHAPAAADATDGVRREARVVSPRRACRCGSRVRAPASVQDAEAWRQRLAAVLQEHGDGIAIVEIAVSREQAALGVFAVKLAATEARSARPAIRIALGGSLVEDAAALSAVYTADLAPYIDLLVVSDARRRHGSADCWRVSIPARRWRLQDPGGVDRRTRHG